MTAGEREGLRVLGAVVIAAAWFLVGKETERFLYAERPDDCIFNRQDIPEVYRATWRDGERRT